MTLLLLELLVGLCAFAGPEQRHQGPEATMSWSRRSWWHLCSVCMLCVNA